MMGSPTVIELIERHTGIVVMAEHVERRLRPLASDRARALGLSSPSAYLDRLAFEPVSGAEWGRVIMALTNGQTSFFRDPEQFDAIAEVLRARSRAAGGRPLAVWSAGCSTGEEPYSVAILAMELGIRAHVLGTDINTAFLDRARAACYGPWALRRVSEDRRTAWFDAIPGGFRVKAPVRAQVRLVRFNLARDRPPESPVTGGHWDVILCRNVFLYFNRQRMGDACRRLAMALAPSGRLFVAASETLHGLDLPLLPDIIGTRVAYRTAPAHGARPGVGPHVRPKITPVKGQDAAQSVGAAESARTARPSQTAGDSPTPRPSQTDGASRSPEAAGENGAAHRPHPGVGPPVRPKIAPVKGHAGWGAPSFTAPPKQAPDLPAEAPAVRGLRPIIERVASLADAGRIREARDLLVNGHRRRESGGADGVVYALTRGHLDLREHALGGALEAYAGAADIDPLLPEIHYFQGLVHRKRGAWEEAAEALRRALFLAPSFWQASYLLAGAFDRLSSPHAAASERARTRRCLIEPAPPMTFLSHPLFVRWFGVDEVALRRLFRVPRR